MIQSQMPKSALIKQTSRLIVTTLSMCLLVGMTIVPILKPTASNTSQATMILVTKPAEIAKCTGCHASDLKGRKGFSPSLTKSGVLKIYNKKSFEAVMNTGKTSPKSPAGGMVKPPMPVYKFTPAVSDSIYKYLNTLP